MLDVDFLLNTPRPDGHLVYIYRTGLLKKEVFSKLKNDAAAKGAFFASVAPEGAARKFGSILPIFGRTHLVCIVDKHVRVNSGSADRIMQELL